MLFLPFRCGLCQIAWPTPKGFPLVPLVPLAAEAHHSQQFLCLVESFLCRNAAPMRAARGRWSPVLLMICSSSAAQAGTRSWVAMFNRTRRAGEFGSLFVVSAVRCCVVFRHCRYEVITRPRFVSYAGTPPGCRLASTPDTTRLLLPPAPRGSGRLPAASWAKARNSPWSETPRPLSTTKEERSPFRWRVVKAIVTRVRLLNLIVPSGAVRLRGPPRGEALADRCHVYLRRRMALSTGEWRGVSVRTVDCQLCNLQIL